MISLFVRPAHRLVRAAAISVFTSFLLAASLSAASYPFFDNFEGGLGAWNASGTWGVTTVRATSPTHSATDSPGAFYNNNSDTALELASPLDLSVAIRPVLGFYHQYALEENYDFARVEVSTNNGVSWLTSPLATYTGNSAALAREQIDLSAYAGASGVRFRFRILTDVSVITDGWYVDDVRVGEAPQTVTLSLATNATPTRVELRWTVSAATNFSAYRVYRSLAAGADWRKMFPVAELTSRTATNYTDIAVSPKTRYFYWVMVVTAEQLHSLSNELQVNTPTGMDYPFLDNAEGGPNMWVAEAPWSITEEIGASGTHSWTDSAGGQYTNGIPSLSLTLVSPLCFQNRAIVPVLAFNQQRDFAAGDSGNVEISTNNGAGWTTLAQYTGTATNGWQRARISLAAYTNAAEVLLRFRVTTDPSGTGDGWHLDDIAVAESPSAVPEPALDQITSHSIRVNWTRDTNAFFSRYMVFRSTTPNAGINGTLFASIADQAVTSVVDTNLALDTVYYYRVYTANSYGVTSPDSPQESSARTLNNPAPFLDNFEGSLTWWNFTGTWGVSTNEPFAGTFCLTDSPQGLYNNNVDSYAVTAVNLVGTTNPVLRFMDSYKLGAGDWCRVELSTDGSSWGARYSLYAVTRTNWAEQSIDLTPYRTCNNLRIRFRFISDSSVIEDGWRIDNVNVEDRPLPALACPFFENFEHGLSNWLHAPWDLETNQPFAGNYAVNDTVNMPITADGDNRLILNGVIDLTNTVNPQLTYWVRGSLSWRSYYRAYVSTDSGNNWTQIDAIDHDWSSGWTRRQISLAGYKNQKVRLMFQTYSIWGTTPWSDLVLDNISIQDMPAAVVLNELTPHLKSVDVTWTPSTLGSAFARNEVYRATHASAGPGDTLIGTFTNASVVSLTDSNLTIGATYYYRVFTVDTNDTYIPSNERITTTVPLNFPLADSFDTLNQWVFTGNWGIDTNAPFSGIGCASESPTGDYGNSQDSYLMTAINLVGTTNPVLRFWDSYRLGSGDWGRVELSTDGSSWSQRYTIYTGLRTNWLEHAIDLTPYRTCNNLRIRFHMWSDGGGTEDGWKIDNVSVRDDAPLRQLACPFFEGFENGLTNWLNAPWDLETNQPYAGSYAVNDSVNLPMGPDSTFQLVLNGEINLTNTVNPQLTYWVRGSLSWRSYYRAYVSTDSGNNWTQIDAIDHDWSSGWTRRQISLAGYKNQKVRLLFQTYSIWGTTPWSDLVLDNISIQDMPAAVILNEAVPHLMTTDLSWTVSSLGSSFVRNEVRRSTSPGVGPGDTLIGTFTNASVVSLTDSNLTIGATYYYRVFTVDTNDTYIPSNERTVSMVPLSFPLTDGMDNLDRWMVTGTWGIDTNRPGSGTGCLSESPVGDYGNSIDTFAMTSINLLGTTNPVLRFRDSYRLGSGDWGRVEISTDGSSWNARYGIYSITRTNWAEQSIDLTEWRGYPNVRIRFRFVSDSSGTDDGWRIDDVSVTDVPLRIIPAPFFEGFEHGLTNWQRAPWSLETNLPYAGNYAINDTVNMPLTWDGDYRLALDGLIDLTNTVNPQLTYYVKGGLWWRSYFRVYVSNDKGWNWTQIDAIDHDWSSDWAKRQISLAGYRDQKIRLLFRTYSIWGTTPSSDLIIDNIGVGDAAPSAPTVYAPEPMSVVPTRRPTLSVNNADSYQGIPLTYRFEVYADATLTNLVAQVPVVASGVTQTLWQVDVTLDNNTQYWWRCRASADTNVGPWMVPATFVVNEVNDPPYPVTLADPPHWVLDNTNSVLSWYPTSDPDLGDTIIAYQLQVDDDAGFGSPIIDASNITVNGPTLPPGVTISRAIGSCVLAGQFAEGRVYYWRVRAQDSRYLWSPWPASRMSSFAFVQAPPPEPSALTRLVLNGNATATVHWAGATNRVYIEYTPTLNPPQWTTLTGRLSGSNATVGHPDGITNGFYRLRLE